MVNFRICKKNYDSNYYYCSWNVEFLIKVYIVLIFLEQLEVSVF